MSSEEPVNQKDLAMGGASATPVLIGLLCWQFLVLVSSNRVLKDGSSSGWATASASGSGTAIGIETGSGSGDSIGVGIGVAGSGFGTGSGTGLGTGIGIGIGVGGDSGLGTGVGIGIGGTSTGTVCDRPSCKHVRKEPKCNHGTRCNPNNEEPSIEIPIWVPGECGGEGVVFESPVCVTSGCEEVECNHDRIRGSSRTRKTNKKQTSVTKKH